MKTQQTLILASLLLAATTPMMAEEEAVTKLSVPYTRFTLPNGLNVILHEDHSTPVVAINVWYHVGSAREKPGRTGFAHLFEHIMFEGSENVPEGQFDRWLESAGGNNNGSTDTDRTNYWETVPSNALDLALFLESDRMGHLLGAMSPEKVDGQRDVVKNERRQSYENRPYGMAFLRLYEELYPVGHPYSWPVIGSMEDLSAASYDDVLEFFRAYYGPGNASLSIAGDIDPEHARTRVEHWFSDVPAGADVPPLSAPPVVLAEDKRVVLTDKVQLPRLYMCWHSPAMFAPGDAELDILASVLGGGKSSRLYRRLVYDDQSAQDAVAFQASSELGSVFCIGATARSGHTLDELETSIQDELDRIMAEGLDESEIERGVNAYATSFLDSVEESGGFNGKADLLNHYYFRTGNPDYFEEDLARYRALDASDVKAALETHLTKHRVVLGVIPEVEEEAE